MTTEIHRAIEAVWRIESAKLIAALTRIVKDVGLAEDLAQDALLAAMEKWPETGVPANPGAWLMSTAKFKAIDGMRRAANFDRKQDQVILEMELGASTTDPDARLDDHVGDDLLRLVFIACHPVLSMEARVALTLRLLGGLTTDEIARAFLASEPTIAQRIVRAKKTLADAKVPFEVPRGEDFESRLAAVLQVIYLVFNEGYSATAGEDWMRPALCEEALRLGRVLAGLAPQAAEVHGLVALMEIQASRSRARIGAGGAPILLMDQNRGKWDQLLIRRGLAALDRAWSLDPEPGPYTLQAAIAACHARATRPEDTDWLRIVDLYRSLGRLTPSPVVDLNQAVAMGMAGDADGGLAIVDGIIAAGALTSYHLLPSVRADLLMKLGRLEEARTDFTRAASMTRNARERDLLLSRASAAAAATATSARAPSP